MILKASRSNKSTTKGRENRKHAKVGIKIVLYVYRNRDEVDRKRDIRTEFEIKVPEIDWKIIMDRIHTLTL